MGSHRTGYPGRHQHHLRSGCAAVHGQDYPGGSYARQRHGRFHKSYSGYHDTREEPHHRLLGVLLGDLGARRNQQKAGNCLWWVQLADAPVTEYAVLLRWWECLWWVASFGVSLQMNGGLACSKMTSGAGSAVSNTATFGTVQPVVSQIGSGVAANSKATPTASTEN